MINNQGVGKDATAEVPPEDHPRRRSSESALWKKILLAAATFLAFPLVLEILARLFFPYPAPVRLRDGIFVNTLPLTSGFVGHNPVFPVTKFYLPQDAREDEIRVFVFGESSVEGQPWDYSGAPPTMLYEQAIRAYPELDLTVVNMGRGASVTRDTYYYLLSVQRFRPDIVIFYQGGNDAFAVDFESCLPATQPIGHAVWRQLVQHSRLLWNLRVFFPTMVQPDVPHTSAESACEPSEIFERWTDILVDSAKEMGAEVVVSLPVLSFVYDQCKLPLEAPGIIFEQIAKPDSPTVSDDCEALLDCRLTAGCDVDSALVRYVEHSSERREFFPPTLEFLWAGWRRSAARFGASVLDFPSLCLERSPGGVLGPPLIVDDIHLSLSGYWLLAETWLNAIRPRVGEGTAGDSELSGFAFDEFRQSIAHQHESGLLKVGFSLLRQENVFLAAYSFQKAVDLYQNERAQVVLGWLRRGTGLDPNVPPNLTERVRGFDLESHHRP